MASSATRAVHICYGYGTPAVLAWKTKNTDWGHYGVTFPLLARSSVDQVSVECAASGVDLAVLRELGAKDVMLGAIDVGTEEVETADVVAGRLRGRSSMCRRSGCFPALTAGWCRAAREASRGKMRALAEGAAIVRAEFVGRATQTRGRGFLTEHL